MTDKFIYRGYEIRYSIKKDKIYVIDHPKEPLQYADTLKEAIDIINLKANN